MDLIKRKPFETLVLLLVIYYSLIVGFFEPVIFSVKMSFIMSAFGVWGLFLLFGVAFSKELDKVKEYLLKVFLANEFGNRKLILKMGMLILLSIPITIITSLSEYMISSIFIRGGSVAIGFPLSIYSFSVNKFIFWNLFTDFILHMSVLLFLGYILMKDTKKI
jgi:hypothetical protein